LLIIRDFRFGAPARDIRSIDRGQPAFVRESWPRSPLNGWSETA